ncbi:MAG TPA: DUF1559 domain-containing protein [Abditibacterium sp.]|jgi:prepilin-type processing-associated H-X9-DG protein
MRNRKKWSLSEKVLFLTPALFLGAVGAMLYLPDYSRVFEASLEKLGIPTREMPRRSSCQSNLKQIALGVRQYVRDYDEKHPLIATKTADFGWGGILQPYLKSTLIFHCPKNSKVVSSNPAAKGYTDYFYNARLSNVSEAMIEFSAFTVLFGEGTSSDARYAKTQLPPEWLKPKSPAQLHFERKSATIGGANYAFSDGHVKWFKPQDIGVGLARNGGATFSIQ